jgi:hypothetical protein
VYYGVEEAVSEISTKQRSVDDNGSASRCTHSLQSNNSRERCMKIMRMRETEGGLLS